MIPLKLLRILVTGGAGFIGKHLVKSLIEKGNAVTIFDNFSNSSKKSVSDLIDIGAKVIEGDIIKYDKISDAVKDQEIVIHLAAKISVQESIRNPLETFQVNVNGTKNVLVACEKNRVKKLIVASSAAVYGESLPDIKLTEESETNPISPYGESKLKMEQKIREFTSKHNIDCVILRFFNIYGIGQSDEYAGVISKFANCIKHNIPLTIYGNGNQTRDFVAIEDIVNLICRIVTLRLEKRFNVYNIGNEKSTIFDLANLMIESSGKNIEIIFKERKQGEIIHSAASIDKAKENLGYNPEICLKKGIEKFLFHQNNI